jgi:hypothetical protein
MTTNRGRFGGPRQLLTKGENTLKPFRYSLGNAIYLIIVTAAAIAVARLLWEIWTR